MAPRRSTAKAGTTAGASKTVELDDAKPALSNDLSGLVQQVSDTLGSWPEQSGSLRQVISKEVDALQSNVDAKLFSARLSQAVLTVLESNIEVEPLSAFLKELVEGWNEDRQDVLWESLVDVVEVLEESKEDCDDLIKVPEGMDVDGGSNKGGPKGIELLKSLLVSPTTDDSRVSG